MAGYTPLSLHFSEGTPLKSFTDLEWIETDGLGGWSSSTVCCANTRRYHGILVSALLPPVKRVVMLSRLDETVVIDGSSYPLATRIYPGAITPEGYHLLRKFAKDPFPTFYYSIPTALGTFTLKKSIAMPQGCNAAIIRYELMHAPCEALLELEPFIAARDYHALTHVNQAIDTRVLASDAIVSFKPYSDLPALRLFVPGASFSAEGRNWYYQFEYEKEKERGLDYLEDLYQYGMIRKKMKAGEVLHLLATTEELSLPDAEGLMDKEKKRRLALLEKLPKRSAPIDIAALAADQFIVKRGTNLKTLIAGYHWFTDWGRDTMLSLPGLCLSMGRFQEAKEILLAFTEVISQGMLPNRFPDEGEKPEYNSVDASLWFFIALYLYYIATKDSAFVRMLYPKLLESIAWYDKGTRYGIKTDSDGLLLAGEPSVQLTWMDAKIGDWVVTPRSGKAVEINALWHNALQIAAEFAALTKDYQTAATYAKRADAVACTFAAKFWNDASGCLYDVIQDSGCDASIRPNQIIALALPFEILDTNKAIQILKVVEEKLLTPFGLRSLDPSHPSYKKIYKGDQWQRDSAYHQGTVWSWLLGPYITALARYRGQAGIAEAQDILKNFSAHFFQAGIGTISEIFDAEPPHQPRGCIAQAWGVAEILRTLIAYS